MRVLATAAACLFLIVSPGCIVATLHPAYDDASITFDDALVGAWKSAEDETTVEVARGEWRSYRVTVRSERETATLSAHTTRVGGSTIVDVMPEAGVDLAALSIAVHALYRVDRSGDTLTVSALDYEAARRALPGRLGVSAVFDDRQNVLITAGTADLRTWLARTGPGAPVFATGTTLTKVRPQQ